MKISFQAVQILSLVNALLAEFPRKAKVRLGSAHGMIAVGSCEYKDDFTGSENLAEMLGASFVR